MGVGGVGRCSAALPAAGARQQLRAASSRREKHGMRERTRALRAGDGKARREVGLLLHIHFVCLVCGFILLDESQYEDDFRPSPGDARARVTPMRLSVVSGLSHFRFLRKVFSPPLRSPLARAVLHPPHRTSTRTQKYSTRTLLFSSNPQTPRTLVTTLVRVLLCTRLQKVLPSS